MTYIICVCMCEMHIMYNSFIFGYSISGLSWKEEKFSVEFIHLTSYRRNHTHTHTLTHNKSFSIPYIFYQRNEHFSSFPYACVFFPLHHPYRLLTHIQCVLIYESTPLKSKLVIASWLLTIASRYALLWCPAIFFSFVLIGIVYNYTYIICLLF